MSKPFPNSLLSTSTWRTVGLTFTTLVFGLGSLTLINPTTAAASLGVEPNTPEGHDINRKSMVFLGIRDIAVAGMLGWFHWEGKQREMGVVFMGWVLVAAVDTWVAAQGPRGVDGGIGGLVAGGLALLFVGAGLMQA